MLVVIPRLQREISQPPRMPTMSPITVNIGSIITVATTLVATSFLMGFVPRARRASICSVTYIEPIPAVLPAPTLPATIRATRTGPISLIIEVLTRVPTYILAPNLAITTPD